MTAKELRQKYIEFFKSKGHVAVPSASLIPENDPSVLFTTAGMHPLVPFLMGEKHPAGNKLVNYQKCIRTNDIDEVGDQWHLTFFEMLGNWSLDDYGKKEAIEYSFEFLTDKKWLGIPVKKLAVTVFRGDNDISEDSEAYEVWSAIGIPKERIYKYNKKENWWGPAGITGPCGPDSEIFYITDKLTCCSKCQPGCDCGKYVELWNNVFMEYNKISNNKFEPLQQKNIDTGMGVERVVAVLNGDNDNYQGDLKLIIRKLEELSNKKYEESEEIKKSMRIITDHLRAATFIMGDDLGIAPSNVDQGYVVRKLIRRAIRHGRMLGIKDNFTNEIGKIIISLMNDVYPELARNKNFVINNFKNEEDKFTRTLQKGLKILNTQMEANDMTLNHKIEVKDMSPIDNIPGFTPFELTGKWLFNIYQTFGFPLELSLEEISRMRKIDRFEIIKLTKEFNQEMKKHQELSRTAAAGKFKGGLGEMSEQVIKYHTTTHLLQQALKQVLGDHIAQKGSNITDERLRFDFSHPEKMTAEEKKRVTDIVNEQIDKDLAVTMEEMPVDEAKKSGAIGLFTDKYGKQVKVYSIGNFSKEICGGPHIKRTGKLGKFRIKKEEASSAGVRRIKAVLE